MHISYKSHGLRPHRVDKGYSFLLFHLNNISCNILLCFWHIFSKILGRALMKLLINFSSPFQDVFLKFSRTHMKTVRSFETSGINDLATRCNKPQNLTPYFLPRSLAGQSSQTGTALLFTVCHIIYFPSVNPYRIT